MDHPVRLAIGVLTAIGGCLMLSVALRRKILRLRCFGGEQSKKLSPVGVIFYALGGLACLVLGFSWALLPCYCP